MEWLFYKKKLSLAAINAGFDQAYIDRCLSYAEKLHAQNLPIIYNQEHLSQLLGYKTDYLYKASNSQKHFYRTYEISKRSGGQRTISEPLPSLKEIQKWILQEILYKVKVSPYAKAYVPKLSIKDNARFHKCQSIVLSLDISDFFGSIEWYKVFGIFTNLGYCESVSVMLANLTTLDKCLPQGAPTSPALSNIFFLPIDNRISKFTSKNKIRYTRYADDLTFSGDLDAGSVIKLVAKILADYSLKLNKSKTHVMKKSSRQEVTGIVVNEKLQASKELRSILRQEIYYIEKFGLDSHMDRKNITKANYIHHLLGVANHIKFISSEDKDANRAIDLLKSFL